MDGRQKKKVLEQSYNELFFEKYWWEVEDKGFRLKIHQ